MNGQEAIVVIGEVAEQAFGLQVGEHPKFGGVDPVHVQGSNHYDARAIDVTGPPERLAAFNRWLANNFGPELAELFYDPGANIKHGKSIPAIGGHGSHVHVATEPEGIAGLADAFAQGGAFKGVQDAVDKGTGAISDAAGDLAGQLLDGLAAILGDAAAKIMLNVALVGGGTALIVYGVSKAAGVSEPTTKLLGAIPPARAAGAAARAAT